MPQMKPEKWMSLMALTMLIVMSKMIKMTFQTLPKPKNPTPQPAEPTKIKWK